MAGLAQLTSGMNMSKEYANKLKQAAARRKQIVRLHKSGKGVVWLADRFEVSHQRISKILKEEAQK